MNNESNVGNEQEQSEFPSLNPPNTDGLGPPQFGNWMMDGYCPFPMMSSSGSFDASKGEAGTGEDSGEPGQPAQSALTSSSDEGQMPVNYFVPQVYPYVPKMDPYAIMQALGQWNAQGDNSQQVSRKPADALEQIKSVPTNVQVREMCQLKAWKKRLIKSKVQIKADLDAAFTNRIQQNDKDQQPPLNETSEATKDASDTDTSSNEALNEESSVRKSPHNMEMAWVANRFMKLGPLQSPEEISLYNSKNDVDDEIAEIQKALNVISTTETKCFPYQLLDSSVLKNPMAKDNPGLSLYSSNGPAGTRNVETYKEMPETQQSNEKELTLSDEEAQLNVEDNTNTKNDDEVEFDNLEDELLDGFSLDDNEENHDGDEVADFDLDEEFDFEVAETSQAVPDPIVPIQPQSEEPVASSDQEDDEMFGEIEGTFSYETARSIRLMNQGDIFYDWRKFRREAVGKNLTIADFIEFENSRKVMYEARLQELYPELQQTQIIPDPSLDLNLMMSLLYATANANLKLLMQYDHPDVKALSQSLLYDLNSPSVIYSTFITDDEFTPRNAGEIPAEILQPETDALDNSRTDVEDAPKSDSEAEMETDEMLLQGKESDIRRNWRRRLQTLGKEARLALVNMGKSLKDIENASSSIEQSKAYDSVVEFCEVAAQFKNRDYLGLLNHSFDDVYEKMDPHNAGKDSGSNRRELIHTRVALNLNGILPCVGASAKMQYARFHRPDFRIGLFDAHLKSIRGNYNGEWSSWSVKPVVESTVGANFYDDDAGINAATTADPSQIHPSNYFIHSQDLTLGDTCKIALMEYIEQTPLVLGNVGMASRIDNWFNTGSESNDNMISLGPMGTLCSTSDGIELFGIKHILEPGQGQAILNNNLYKAPIFIHPRPQGKLQNVHELNGATDFLMIRCKYREEVLVRLRPLQWSSGVALYTVGQCEPKVEVPSPNSKQYVEEVKNLLKAWVLKSVMTGLVYDIKQLRKEARKNFCPTIPEKEVAHVLKQIEGTPIFSSRAQTLERMIHNTIKPEAVCCLESSRVGRSRLKAIGILQLKNPDNVGIIFSKIQQEEKQYQQRLQSVEKRLRELKNSYAKRLEAHGISGELLQGELSQFDINITCSIYGHLEQRNLAPQIRFIEEVLKLTPWNITRDVKQVLTNRGTAQFALHGFGDPSGGRGEAINLLKRQFRDENADVIATAFAAAPVEDLRKLSMEELGKRLKRYGVAESVIKTLPRWDQVALVRQYRDGFGGNTQAEGDNRWRIPPEEYQKKLNEILLRQRAALEPDDPQISDDEAVGADGESHHVDNDGNESIADPAGDASADNIADALLEGFEDESDKDDDLEMRELEILRQIRESTVAGPMTEEERIAEVNKLCAVPGFMWLRQSRKSPTEPFGNERAVFVYGEENIRKMLEWRRKRAAVKRDTLPLGLAMTTVAPVAGKRLCRACGQTGHIASNPKCPLYRGDKSRDASYYSSRAVAGRRVCRFSDSSDGEISASTNALEKDTQEWLKQNLDVLIQRQKRRYTKFRIHDDSEDDSGGESSAVAPTGGSRRKMSNTDNELQGTPKSKHHDSIMKTVGRVLRILEKDPRFKAFVQRIPESVAPNYYKIIKQPMWIQLLKSKVKNRYYNNIVEFMDDMGLIETNCKTFNSPTSPNAWLRQQSELLIDELVQRLSQALVQHIPAPVFDDWITMHKANHRVQLSAAPSGEFV
ncbi:bifunctional Bromodomain/Bromodomain [Babesia duncani]|uniref:Bifunctional Bromodomain/Bromodomain n=1 Tax=Babesia duncani TaxID=323732 RepID=A0AAD9UPZ1_9APIC|nr:bifunctional Bromodomain/Bromodomain [Babesia duncani]